MGGSPKSETPTDLPVPFVVNGRLFQPWPFPVSAPPGSKAADPPAPVFPQTVSTPTVSVPPVSQAAALPGSKDLAPFASAPSAPDLSAPAPPAPEFPPTASDPSFSDLPAYQDLAAPAAPQSAAPSVTHGSVPQSAAPSATHVSVPPVFHPSAPPVSQASGAPVSHVSVPTASQLTAPPGSQLSATTGSQFSVPPVAQPAAPPVSQVSVPPASRFPSCVAQISIPEEIQESSDPLWKSFVVGYFIGDAPHVGTIHATVNRLWANQARKSKIDVQFISAKTVLFRIENDQTRSKVVKRKYWHISNVPLVVNVWNPETAKNPPDLSALPLWVDLQQVPSNLFSERGLRCLGSATGKFVKLHPNTERCTRLDVARILVEVNLHRPLIEQITFKDFEGKDITVGVAYPWLPPRCSICHQWGHLLTECKTKVNVNGDLFREGIPKQDTAVPPISAAIIPVKTVVSDLIKELSLVTPIADIPVSDEGDSAEVDSEAHGNEWKIMGKKGTSSPKTTTVLESAADSQNGTALSLSAFDILGQIGDNEDLEDGEITTVMSTQVPKAAEADQIDIRVSHKPKPQAPKSSAKPSRKALVGSTANKFLNVHVQTRKASTRKL